MSLHRFAGLALLALAGCASQTTYHPADSRGGEGYTETRLAPNHYRISFNGNSLTPSETVQNYALLRAAELTLQEGYDWFRLADQETGHKDRTTTVVDNDPLAPPPPVVYQQCGLLACRTTVIHSPAPAISTATTTTRRSYHSEVEIVLEKYPKPNTASAHDARDVARTLRSAMSKSAE
ncbi:MAG TPA: hypothetical protein VLI06_16620 [Solimonas sp.]|nr:hypothetical protein [Solimonas sp.]